MSSIKVLKVLNVGKGQTMEITVNESEPEDSIDRYVMDTVCTGEEALEIPPHWHKNHQEFLSVIEGRVEITLDGKTTLMKAGDPAVLVPRRAVHSVKGFKGERLIFREKPDPAGIYKALFFNDVFSKGGFGGVWHTLRAFYDGDAYLALPLHSQLIDQAFVSVLGGIAHLFISKKPETL
ncbi:hypothetical protein OIDMADRAFT_21493 [Oidiodendron maius Zn]|uniref:Cupin type-2 domain-containing protein n=1 Tax=Oidiodendron maius (strain Zn) TaxID=913774 RepID=A0A0C3CVL3_OIDMZ|nr:hypothetical protein OIDMADRAFT_21493 [Oidiodendron maius Zn]